MPKINSGMVNKRIRNLGLKLTMVKPDTMEFYSTFYQIDGDNRNPQIIGKEIAAGLYGEYVKTEVIRDIRPMYSVPIDWFLEKGTIVPEKEERQAQRANK